MTEIKERGWVFIELRNVTQEKKSMLFSLIYNFFFHICCRNFKNLKFIHYQLTLCFLAYATEIALIFIHVFIFAKKYLEKKGRSLRISWHYAEGVFHKLQQSVMEGWVGQK